MRPRLLDLFCGAGGAAMGYHRAGFDVVGVDIAPQPHYAFEFHRGDALEDLRGWGSDVPYFDAIHASPPCQFFTTLSSRWRGGATETVADTRVDLLTPTLALLEQIDLPWVVENVEGAASVMKAGAPYGLLRLHGGMFGLGVHRPRLFRSNVLLLSAPTPKAKNHRGVYGRAPDGRKVSKSSECYAVGSLEEAQEAMGMDWADWHGTKEAIPPAYTEFIGTQLLQHLRTPSTTQEAPDG